MAQRLGISKLSGLAVAIQGLGNVGMSLCEALHRAGVRLVVADIDPQKAAYAARRFGASVVHADEILMAEVDVLAPCALGGVITVELATNMRALAIGGSANNQLATAEVGHILHDRRVLYAPDYVINAGGVISVANEYLGRRGAEAQIAEIGCRLQRIFEASDAQREPTNVVADTMAREVLMAVGADRGQRTDVSQRA